MADADRHATLGYRSSGRAHCNYLAPCWPQPRVDADHSHTPHVQRQGAGRARCKRGCGACKSLMRTSDRALGFTTRKVFPAGMPGTPDVIAQQAEDIRVVSIGAGKANASLEADDLDICTALVHHNVKCRAR
jgi:hypothetical protein